MLSFACDGGEGGITRKKRKGVCDEEQGRRFAKGDHARIELRQRDIRRWILLNPQSISVG